jgi:phosphatidylglycerol:prolipoprotein diacylglycerol transferase
MSYLNRLSWLYWNPPRDVFTIPLIDRPIAWYGVLFVLGFILGYFIVIPMISQFLFQSKRLSTLDILNWSLFIQQLKSKENNSNSLASKFYQELDPHLKQKIKNLTDETQIDVELKSGLLKELNRFLQHKEVERSDLEKAFPHIISSINQVSYFLSDRLCWFLIAGTVIGARLGVIFFYDWPYYRSHPSEIIKIWKGGLASHGGALGIAFALYLYVLYVRKWIPSVNFLKLLDIVSIPAALGAGFIRLGNFMNQEILGTPTTLPWGIIFGDPADESPIIPRHPVQLYEAILYFSTFFFLYFLWKKNKGQIQTGMLSGILLISVFLGRFILEFWKSNQESFVHLPFFQMGQLLSLPFVLLGIFFIFYGRKLKLS